MIRQVTQRDADEISAIYNHYIEHTKITFEEEEMLKNGEVLGGRQCLLLLYHFLDRVATHILAFEGDSNVHYFEGNFAEYEENKIQRLGDQAIKRIKYAPLINL